MPSSQKKRIIRCVGHSRPEFRLDMRVMEYKHPLIDLLLLIDRELSRTHVDQQEETTTGYVLVAASI
jgi:hypothetical protein